MEMINNSILIDQTQTEIMSDDKLEHVKQDHIQNIVKRTISSKKTQGNNIDTYINNLIENGELIEANNAIKYIKYCVKQWKHIINQNSAKPNDYDKWTDEEQYKHVMDNIEIYVPSIPHSLSFFISAALYRGDCNRNSMEKPLWLDMEKFQRGQKFARDHIFSIILANMLSLFQIFAFTDGLKPLIFSQQSHTPYLAFKRYLSTACRIRNWMTEDPWTVGTRAYNDIQNVRRMHRAIRLKLCEHDNEEIDMLTKIQNPWCSDRETILKDLSSCPHAAVENGCLHLLITPKGLNQADMAATQFAFMGMILLYPREFGIYASDEDMAAFCHTWRSIGYLLGIEDRYNFCRGSLKEIKQRSRDFIEIWVKPYLREVTPEWEHMLRCITEGGTYCGGKITFKMSLLSVTNLLDIDMSHIRSTLTYREWFGLMIQHFIFRYVIKLRFVREYLNNKFHEKLNKAIKYNSKEHEKLKKRSEKVLAENR